MIKKIISKLIDDTDLEPQEMRGVMQEILTGVATPSQISAFLALLRKKGETEQELTQAVKVMRKYVKPIRINRRVILDTCGTGGDKKGTFNISTTVAFVAAGAGITVAKHGNRCVSSHCGSADLLEALGININLNEQQLKRCLKEIGIAFLFAPNLHPAMKYALPARREMGIRTMFNLLGPLTNPAGATHQLIGVYDGKWTAILAKVLGRLDTSHALIVHGEDGLDEITTTTKTIISELRNKRVRTYKISPEDFGIRRAKMSELRGADSSLNIQILTAVLQGEVSAYRDIVLLNAAAAIYASDMAKNIKEGMKMARESIDSGRAYKKLQLLRDYSQRAI
jgi:anthranilate phosphoribosyltransferase